MRLSTCRSTTPATTSPSHPVCGGLFNFGGGEIAIIYDRAPCKYQSIFDVTHSYPYVHTRAQSILTRIRADASTPDIGYPVAMEVSPERIFTTYYYTLDDGNGFGGTRFIAGTFFSLGSGR